MTMMTHPERAKRRDLIRKDLLAGMEHEAAARKYGVSFATVEMIGKHAGVSASRRLRSQVPQSTWRILARLLNTSDRIVDIAKSFGISPQRVDQIRSKAESVGIRLHHSRRRNQP